MTLQVTKLPLYPELILIRNNLLHQAWTERGLVYRFIYVFVYRTLAMS
jgi:hypothetical protein